MRFTFCTSDGWNAFNGINVWLSRFLPALRARGHDARALVFAWSRPDDCALCPRLRSNGVPISVIFPPRTTEAATRLAARHAAAFQPDVFVANHMLPGLFAGGWIRAAGMPTVAMLHNDDDEYRARLENFGGGPPFFRPSAIVAISEGLERLARRLAPEVAVERIPYGVPEAPAAARPADGGPFRLVYHGRFAREQKRILETVSACVRVARRFPSLEIDFFGDGPQRGEAAALLARDDAGGRVRLREALGPNEVMAVLPRFHAAVLLSDYEGLGLSMLEAMGCGVVPVCHRTASGLPDFIRDGENGLFVADRDAEFDRAIERLLSDPALWARLSRGALATVRERYAQSSSLLAWERLAGGLAGSKPAAARVRLPLRLRLPPVDRRLASEDRRYPGLARAAWRRIRFGSRQ